MTHKVYKVTYTLHEKFYNNGKRSRTVDNEAEYKVTDYVSSSSPPEASPDDPTIVWLSSAYMRQSDYFEIEMLNVEVSRPGLTEEIRHKLEIIKDWER